MLNQKTPSPSSDSLYEEANWNLCPVIPVSLEIIKRNCSTLPGVVDPKLRSQSTTRSVFCVGSTEIFSCFSYFALRPTSATQIFAHEHGARSWFATFMSNTVCPRLQVWNVGLRTGLPTGCVEDRPRTTLLIEDRHTLKHTFTHTPTRVWYNDCSLSCANAWQGIS